MTWNLWVTRSPISFSDSSLGDRKPNLQYLQMTITRSTRRKKTFVRDAHPHLPYQLVEYLNFCSRGGPRSGLAAQAPDYGFLRGLFMELLLSEIDWTFDWTLDWEASSVDFSNVDECEWDDWHDWDERDVEETGEVGEHPA